MPIAVLKEIIAFSSEDPMNPAKNLLSMEHGKKWKTKNPGEASAHVIISFDKSQSLVGIDIGNEHSAFIEVLVGNTIDNFQTVVLASSYMTPSESKQSTNSNRVRSFSNESLIKEVAKMKWKFIKVVCSQPFNKYVQYGLSFIKIHIPVDISPEINSKEVEHSTLKTPKKFRLREPSIEDDNTSPGFLFKRWKHSQNNENNNNPKNIITAAIKKNNNLIKKINIMKPNVQNLDQVDLNLKSVASNSTTDDANDNTLSPNPNNSENSRNIYSLKRKLNSSAEVSQKKTPEYKPFNQLFKNITIVISGIQNPQRASLRKMALEMGASYEPVWNNKCTHLICPFKNTPKYKEVKGKGRIVQPDWITKCYDERKRLSWRKFATDQEEAEISVSEDEIYDISLKQKNRISDLDDSTDTEEEIKRIKLTKKNNVFEMSTDEEDKLVDSSEHLSNVGNFFKGKKFAFSSNITKIERFKLEQLIKKYAGEITETFIHADFILSNNKDITVQYEGKIVKPSWILECNDMECLIPIERYLL